MILHHNLCEYGTFRGSRHDAGRPWYGAHAPVVEQEEAPGTSARSIPIYNICTLKIFKQMNVIIVSDKYARTTKYFSHFRQSNSIFLLFTFIDFFMLSRMLGYCKLT